MHDLAVFFLDSLAQFAGGRGEIGNHLVRFGLAATFWGGLLILALNRHRQITKPRERLLIWGFALGFCREVFMLGVTSLYILNWHPAFLHRVFPPLEHALTLTAVVVVAAAFIDYLYNDTRLARGYLWAGVGANIVCFLLTSGWWYQYIQEHPQSSFGTTWCDWLFHLTGCALISIPIAALLQKRGWLRNIVLLALSFFLLDEILKLIDLSFGERYENLLAPIRHSLHLWTIPLLGFVYIKEMILERTLLSAVVEQATEGIIIINADRKLDYVNPAFLKMTDYQLDEVLGRDAGLFRSGIHDNAFYDEIWDTLARGESWQGRIVNRKRDGSPLEADRTFFPVRDRFGNIMNYVSLVRDMSEEAEMKKQLLRSQKLQAIGTLAGGVAHDFNNILTPIMLYTQLALDELPADAETHSNLEQVLRSAERARLLVQQIMTFSRQSEQPRQPVQILPIIEETLQLLRTSFPAQIEIQQRLDANDAMVLADPTQIHQIFLNLANNARQAIGDASGILEVKLQRASVSASNRKRPPQLVPGPYVTLEVRDSGCGMTAELENRIFDPFFTTKEVGQGTGLGLSVVQGIVQSMGGAIFVRSCPGQGSAFMVYFPCTEGETRQVVTPVSQRLEEGNEQILLVDDDQPVARATEAFLKKLGYRVVTVTDSGMALNLFRQTPDDFDLLITDQEMPGLSGQDLAQACLDLHPDLPVLFFTGYSASLDMERFPTILRQQTIIKPFSQEEFSQAIRQLLGRTEADSARSVRVAEQ